MENIHALQTSKIVAGVGVVVISVPVKGSVVALLVARLLDTSLPLLLGGVMGRGGLSMS